MRRCMVSGLVGMVVVLVAALLPHQSLSQEAKQSDDWQDLVKSEDNGVDIPSVTSEEKWKEQEEEEEAEDTDVPMLRQSETHNVIANTVNCTVTLGRVRIILINYHTASMNCTIGAYTSSALKFTRRGALSCATYRYFKRAVLSGLMPYRDAKISRQMILQQLL
ncbi:hypothetical protein Pcinc_021470 [Petrolisthes cinctipes]|uniref:Uncharacterized protein n=1 Tax=Petrolisthes cinctipes TaxID=88211 RepID=A0AAE1KIA1_PETCI|nr:hypothetical protein Pcinc_021470 [Petrolisthes cinctipes]